MCQLGVPADCGATRASLSVAAQPTGCYIAGAAKEVMMAAGQRGESAGMAVNFAAFWHRTTQLAMAFTSSDPYPYAIT